jgi:hypothetical protein
MKLQSKFPNNQPLTMKMKTLEKNYLPTIKSVLVFSFIYLLLTLGTVAGTTDRESSLLWKVEGKGIETSYIFGTFHMISQNDFVLKDPVKDALKNSDVLVLELDMDDPSMQQQMIQKIQMLGGASIKNMLEENEFNAVDSVLKATMGQSLSMMQTFKPFIVSSMIIPTLIEGQVVSYEMQLITLAKQDNKEVLGIETVAEQMAIFDSIPYQQQADELAEMIMEREKTLKEFKRMINLYNAEDIEGLYAMFYDYYETDKEIKLLLHDRNIKWQSRIPEIIKDQSAFIGVGAGHLGGEKGIVQLLRDAGYKVTAVQ